MGSSTLAGAASERALALAAGSGPGGGSARLTSDPCGDCSQCAGLQQVQAMQGHHVRQDPQHPFIKVICKLPFKSALVPTAAAESSAAAMPPPLPAPRCGPGPAVPTRSGPPDGGEWQNQRRKNAHRQ